MTKATRRSFGRFTLEEDFRTGTSGRVFKATERLSSGDCRAAALKIFPWRAPSDEHSAARFREEANALREFGGKSNIVEVRDFGIDDGIAWIAMEYLPRSLEDIVSDEPAQESTVLAVLRDVACALDFLHSRKPAPVLHRDIKPENILVSDSGVYKIADLELTSAVHSRSTKNHMTPRFAAPESASGDSRAECPASDLYSLGMVAYYLLLGRSLFNQQFDFFDPFATDVAPADPDQQAIRQAQAWMQWHCTPQLVLPEASQVLPAVRPDLSRVIARLTAKNLDERYTSARELLVDLREIDGRVTIFDTSPKSTSTLARAIDWSSRSWTPRAIAIKLAALLVLAVPLAAWAFIPRAPLILLQPGTIFSAQGPLVPVRFDVEDLPSGAEVRVGEGDQAPAATPENKSDRRWTLAANLLIPEPGRTPTTIRIVGAQGRILATMPIVAERRPRLRLRLTTDPPTEAVRLSVTDAEHRAHTITTDADGSASVLVDPGPCEIQADHPRFVLLSSSAKFDVSEDPEQRVRLRLAPRFGTLSVAVDPPNATVSIEREPGSSQAISTADSTAPVSLEPGVWTIRASAPGHQPLAREVHIERGKPARISLQLQPKAPPAPLISSDPPPINLDEVARFVQTHAPCAQFSLTHVEPPGKVRVRGVVLCQAEFDTLMARLAPVADRLMVEIRVDPEETRRLVLAALRKAGGVRPTARLTDEQTRLLIEIETGSGLGLPKATFIASTFVLDPSALTVRAALE